MIGAAYANPTAYGDLHGANWWVWLLCHILADQKSMTIFSMLFGAGILVMTRHIEAQGLPSARLHYRRMGWLILFGLLHGFLLWDGDILYAYGVGGLIVYLLRKIAVGKQLLVAGLLLAIGSGIFVASYYSMPWWPAAQRQELEHSMWQPTAEQEGRKIAAYRLLTSFRSLRALRWTASRLSPRSDLVGSPRASSRGPSISVRGVRNSWLILLKKAVFTRSSSANFSARSRSSSRARALDKTVAT